MAVPLLALGAIARLATLTTWKRRRTFLASATPGLGGWRCALPEPSAWCGGCGGTAAAWCECDACSGIP
jgi:hypothetical protein